MNRRGGGEKVRPPPNVVYLVNSGALASSLEPTLMAMLRDWDPLSKEMRFGFSTSSFAAGRMYPAAARAMWVTVPKS